MSYSFEVAGVSIMFDNQTDVNEQAIVVEFSNGVRVHSPPDSLSSDIDEIKLDMYNVWLDVSETDVLELDARKFYVERVRVEDTEVEVSEDESVRDVVIRTDL